MKTQHPILFFIKTYRFVVVVWCLRPVKPQKINKKTYVFFDVFANPAFFISGPSRHQFWMHVRKCLRYVPAQIPLGAPICTLLGPSRDPFWHPWGYLGIVWPPFLDALVILGSISHGVELRMSLPVRIFHQI